MCRVLAYLGEPLLVDELLYRPDNSLVKQAYDPIMLSRLNLAGFGLAAWDPGSHDPSAPFLYRSTGLPIFDANLKALASKVRTDCLLAHVRGVAYHSGVTVSEQNLHPFRFPGVRLALAHNGDLHRFDEMRYALVEHIRPELRRQIRGNTDTEWIYALLLSQIDDPSRDLTADEIARAIEKTLRVLRRERERAGIRTNSAVNLFLADGNTLVGLRFTFDYGCYPTDDGSAIPESSLRYLSLWYTYGSRYGLHDGEWKMVGGRNPDSVLVASEPLTSDVTSWIEAPEYSLVWMERSGGAPRTGTLIVDA